MTTSADKGEATARFSLGRWWIVVFGAALGSVMGAADLALNGSPARAAADVVILVGYTAILALLRTRSETASALGGYPVDERWQAINQGALAAAGMVGGLVALCGFLIAEASGRDWSGFAIVGAVIGVAYIGTVVWGRLRS